MLDQREEEFGEGLSTQWMGPDTGENDWIDETMKED